jgi:hypothetical protein
MEDPVGAMPRVSQAETWELVASKLWGVCYPAELQRPAPLNLREFIIFIFRELYFALIGSCCTGRSVLPWLI